MARYYRLHLASFIAIEFADELTAYTGGNDFNNRFESVIELYEEGCSNLQFNFVLYSKKREEKLVTPVLIDLVENGKQEKSPRNTIRWRRETTAVEKMGGILMIDL